MRGTRLVALAAIAVSAAPVAQGQDPRLAGRLEPSALATVQRLVDSARVSGLPTEPLVAKALEGAAKHAGGDRIIAAVQSLLRDLGAAGSALGAQATEAEISAGATAVRAGVSPDALRRVRGAREDLTVPVAVLADLVGQGVPADTAVTVILQLAQRGAPDGDYTGLARHVLQDVGAGIPPGVAAAARAGAPPAAARPVPAAGKGRPAGPQKPRP